MSCPQCDALNAHTDLHRLCVSLGWQGGTIHQALPAAVARLAAAEQMAQALRDARMLLGDYVENYDAASPAALTVFDGCSAALSAWEAAK